MIRVKICGLRTGEAVEACVAAGAAYLGFNFFAPSARYVAPEVAAELAALVPPGIAKVGLTVDADDAELDAITGRVPLDMLQLHGRESPDRVRSIRNRFGLPVMKVLPVAVAADLDALADHAGVADQIMLDARPPAGNAVPGGHGQTFDWRLIAGRRWAVPWMLAGGLTPGNVAEAIRVTGALQVDVASGVESARGVKDPALIAAFVDAAQGAPGASG